MDDAEADEEDHADDQGDDRQEHLLGGGFGLGFDGGGLGGAHGICFGGERRPDAGSLIASQVGRCGEFAELVDAEFSSKIVEDLPRGAVGEASPAQRADGFR